MYGEQRLFTLSDDLDNIEVYVPRIQKEQSSESISSPDRKLKSRNSKSAKSITSTGTEAKSTIHKKEYVFLGHREGMAQLLDSDFRLISVP